MTGNGHGNHRPLLHATGELPRHLAALFPQPELFQVFLRALCGGVTIDAIVTGLVHDDLDHRLELVEIELLRHESDARLHRRGLPVEVVPAITGMSGAWTATGQPITWGDDVLTVLMGTLPEDDLIRHMRATDALVVMKIGRNINKVRRALEAAGLTDRAYIIEYATMEGQTVTRLAEAGDKVTPYFSIIVVHGQGRRP